MTLKISNGLAGNNNVYSVHSEEHFTMQEIFFYLLSILQ